jgi:predicted PurR-regulated permease PerM
MDKVRNVLEKLNIKKLNEILNTGSKILKILYTLFIIMAVYIGLLLIQKIEILPFIGTIFKILSPFFIGFFIAWLLNPLITRLTENKKMSRPFAITLVFIALFLIFYIFIVTIFPLFGEQIKDIVSAIPSILTDLKTWAENIFDKVSDLTLQDLTFAKEKFFLSAEKFGTNLQKNLPTMTVDIATKFISGLGTFLLSIVVGFYLLFNFHNVSIHFTDILPKKWRKDTTYLLDSISVTLRKFVGGTLIISLILTIITYIGFTIIGLKAPLLIAVFCGITNLIPYIGPYIGAAAAGLVGFTQGPLIGTFTLAFILTTQTIEGNFLQPMVMSKKMNLHPVTILLALLIFGYYFGILGMIFATPVMALIKIIYIFLDNKFGFFEYDDEKSLKRNE